MQKMKERKKKKERRIDETIREGKKKERKRWKKNC